MIELNESQRGVVASTSRNVVVRAGPGCGKTATIAHVVAAAVASGMSPAKIAAFTFGRRAAGEIADRIKSLGVRGASVGTLHGIAYRLVSHRYGSLGYRDRPVLYSARDCEELLDKARTGTGVKSIAKVRRCLQDMAAGEEVDWDPAIRGVAERYWDRLKADGAADYGLIMIDALRLFRESRLAPPFDLVIIDEGQDLDRLQACFAQELTRGRLMAVSDPDQTIFDWRGAHPGWTSSLKSPEALSLPRSYRCPAPVVEEAKWILGEENGLVPAEHPGEVITCGSGEWCGLIVDKAWATCSTAILCRTNAEADRASAELLLKGISHRRHAAGDQILEREAIRDVLALLAFTELRRSRWVLNRVGKMFQLGAITLSQIVAHSGAAEIDYIDEAIRQSLPLAAYYEEEAQWPSILDKLSMAIGACKLDQRSSDWLLQHAAEFVLETPIPEQLPSAFMAHLGACDDLLPGERETTTCVMTMHAAKGLEFDTVVIYSDGYQAGWKQEPTQEDRRLLYVSATRARRRLIFACPAFSRPWWVRRRLNEQGT